jgi:phosphate acyltransferase
VIALDAMGGDFAPRVAVEGAIKAAQRGISVCLFGDENILLVLLEKTDRLWHTLPISLEHCTQVIEMGDDPSRSVLKKESSSLVRAFKAVRDKKALACVSAGNSGASLVAATLLLGRAPHVLRPAIGDFIPTKSGSIFCIDLGANTDPKPEYILQFAQMGDVYVTMTKNIHTPRIALLSNGAEPYKGSITIKQSYSLLKESGLNFIGNVEARNIFDCNADIVVCDGFAGNVMLKAIQGTVDIVLYWLQQEINVSWRNKLAALVGRSMFTALKHKTDYAQAGGALLLGVQEPCIIAHGCSNAKSIENALVFAYHVAQERFIALFNQQVAALFEQKKMNASLMPQKIRSIFGER